MNTDKFQGICLENCEGWKHMDAFDDMPPPLRRRLARSPFNLCPLCVIRVVFAKHGYAHDNVVAAIAVVSQFENLIRLGELT